MNAGMKMIPHTIFLKGSEVQRLNILDFLGWV